MIFEKAKMSKRLDLAEVALTLAIIDREPWAVKYMLSTQGKSRGYIESASNFNETEKPTPVKIEFVAEDGSVSQD